MSLAGIRCCGYLRVSTARQAGEAQTSLADQRKAIETLATHMKVAVEQWYVDDGASGATVEQRPAMRALLADCEASPRKGSLLGLVLVLNHSRFGRFPDPEESTYWRHHLKKRCGWVVRFAEHDDTEDLELRTVMNAIGSSQATRKRQDVRDNAKRGSRGTASLGYWGTRAPYGYQRRVVKPVGRERLLSAHQRKAPDEKVILAPHPEQAAVIGELFARYATGLDTLATLTLWARDRAPERHWTRAAIRYTLANPAYCGDVVSGRVSGDRSERAVMPRRPELEWVVAPNAHPALVDRAIWRHCQDVLARNRKWTSRVRSNWLLSGVVKCPCGQPYVAGGGNYTKGRAVTHSYRCVTKAGIPLDRCQYPGSIKKEWLEATVVSELSRFIGGKAQQRRIAAHMDAALAERRMAPATTAAALARQITEQSTVRDRLVAAVGDGTLIGEEAREKLASVRRQIARLEQQRDALSVESASHRALDAERDRVMALALTFPRAVRALSGPALREAIWPWIEAAAFDPRTRVLTLDIRQIPASSTSVYGESTHMERPSSQITTRRQRVVGAPK